MPDSATIDTRATASAGEAIHIGGLDHVVLRVGDLDRAIGFYETVLGLHVERRLEPAAVSPQAGPDMAARNMDHFAIRVVGFDAAAVKAHLQRHGIDPGEVRERYGAEGYGPSIYISDPDGNTVELKGEATRGLQAEPVNPRDGRDQQQKREG
jgi:glyoxylase I family protein